MDRKEYSPKLEGSASDWGRLQFAEQRDLYEVNMEAAREVNRLMDAYRERHLETVAHLENFLDSPKVRSYMDKMHPLAKEEAIFRIVNHMYCNDRFSAGDMVMEKFAFDVQQQKNISRLLMLEAMSMQSDIDGITQFTFTNIVARLLKFYPEFRDEEEMIVAAANAFFIELDGATWAKDIADARVYVDLGFFSIEEVKSNPFFVEGIGGRVVKLLKKGDTKKVRVLRDEYMTKDSLESIKIEMEEAAREGFKGSLGHNSLEMIGLVKEFLPKDFLDEKGAKDFILETYLEKMTKGYLGSLLEIRSSFGMCLPGNLTDSRIWQTKYSEVARNGVVEEIESSRGDHVENFIVAFGVPKGFYDDLEIKNSLVIGLRNAIRSRMFSEEALKLIKILKQDDEVWKLVFSCDYLLTLFNETNRYDNLDKLEGFVTKHPDLDIRVDEREMANLMILLEQEGQTLTPDILRKFEKLSKVLPRVLEYLDVWAGSNYPQNATIRDLVEICNDSGLMNNAVYGANSFTIDEVREIASALNEKDISNVAVSFLNILKRGEYMRTVDEQGKAKIMKWVSLIADKAEDAVKNYKDREYRTVLKGHYTKYKKGATSLTDIECLSHIYRQKASLFASALVIMNNSDLIDEVGDFVYRMDPNKSYSMSDKELVRVLKGRFPKIWFPVIS